ncbi:MAG TPA: peptide ABC transporter substrate-binding protein [Candidatus Baltobacteraceae bacterium]
MKRYLAAALMLIVAGCSKGGSAASPRAHWLVIADGSGDIDTLNPHLFTETTLGYIAELTMAYLVRYDKAGRPIPELVTVVPTQANGGISKDGKTITWHLRRGVRWSDGAPFNADDVIFTTNVVNNPANNEVGRDGWDLITKMDEPDKYTVVYHLSKPYASFLPTFFGTAGANPCVLPKHLLANLPNINHAAYNSKPVGIGPFRVTQWRRGDAVEMEANPYYWRGMPKLKRITYKLISDRNTLATQLQTGDVDMWPMVPAAFIAPLKRYPNMTTIVVPSSYYAHLDFNVQRPLVSDIRVREAVRYAIDRKKIVDTVGHGYGILEESPTSVVNPIAPTTAQIPLIPYDPAKANALLDQAGWKRGADGIRVKNGRRLLLDFPYYTGASDADQRIELIRQMLKAVGISIQTSKSAPALFFAPYQEQGIVYGGKYDLTIFSWGTDPVGDLSNLFSCKQIPPNGQDNVRYCNPQVDAWMDQLKNTYDPALHKELLLKISRQIVADVPTINLYLLEDGYTYSTKLTGYAPGAFTPFDDMMNVDI